MINWKAMVVQGGFPAPWHARVEHAWTSDLGHRVESITCPHEHDSASQAQHCADQLAELANAVVYP